MSDLPILAALEDTSLDLDAVNAVAAVNEQHQDEDECDLPMSVRDANDALRCD